VSPHSDRVGGAHSPPVSASAGLRARRHPLTRGRDAATAGDPAAPAASPRLLMLAVHAADTDADPSPGFARRPRERADARRPRERVARSDERCLVPSRRGGPVSPGWGP
jgi:hypothetical protein